MWLLEGRYSEDSRQELSKLLKCGETYTIGRKIPAAIIVESKFVSRTSCRITVGDAPSYPADLDPSRVHSDLALRPKVSIRFEVLKNRSSFTVLQMPRNGAKDAQPIEVQVSPETDFVLHDKDRFVLTTTISLQLVWRPMSVCFAGKIKESAIAPLRSSASKLGLSLSSAKARWRDGFTHLCVQQVKPTESVIEALIQAKAIVTIDYFTEIVRRGNLPRHDSESLETNFSELNCAEFQPDISADEFSDMTDLPRKLQPDPKRTYMLQGTSCVFFVLPSDQNEFSIYRNILTLAGARVYSHNPESEQLATKADFASLLLTYKNSALSYWRNSGTKARSEAPDDGLVVLSSAAHDHTAWKSACTIACSNLRIAMPSGFHSISNAIFSAEIREHFNVIPINPEPGIGSSPLPEMRLEATHMEKATEVQQNHANDQRASPSDPHAQSQLESSVEAPVVLAQESDPSNVIAETPPKQLRRPLKRRTQKANAGEEDGHATRVDDVESVNEPCAEIPATSSSSMKQPADSKSQGTRLTRRTGANRSTSRRSDVFDAILRGSEGQASSLVNWEDGASLDAHDSAGEGPVSAVPRSRRFRMQLDEQDKAESQADTHRSNDRDDHETSVSEQTNVAAGQKRKQSARVGPAQNDDTNRAKRAKPAAETEYEYLSQSQVCLDDDMDELPASDQIIRRETSEHMSGLTVGETPDTEPQFLQALNTQRAKGKRMDEFDTEFNNLRIARPNQLNDREAAKHSSNFVPTGQARRQLEQSQAAQSPPDEDFEAFKRLAHEELRIHVRGNFVQVDFVPLIHRREPTVMAEATTPNGVPNFKKFRPKNKSSQTQSINTDTTKKPALSLTLTKTNDYGIGDAYWKGQSSAKLMEDDKDREHAPFRSRGAAGRSQRRSSIVNLTLSDDDSEDAEFTPVASAMNEGRDARRSVSVVTNSEIDELESSERVNLDLDGMDSVDELDDAEMTMIQRRQKPSAARSGQRSASSTVKPVPRPARTAVRGTKRAAALAIDSNSDDDYSQGAGKKSSIALDLDDFDDDDDDDDAGGDNANFAGFGKRPSVRSARQRAPPPRLEARKGKSTF